MSTKTTKTTAAKTTKTTAKKTTAKKTTAKTKAVAIDAQGNVPAATGPVDTFLPISPAQDGTERFRPDNVTLARWNDEATKVAMATILPALRAKYPTPEPVEGKQYVVDKAALNEYTTAKAGLLVAMGAKSGKVIRGANLITDITQQEMDSMPKTEKEETTTQQKAEKASKAKHAQVETAHGPFRKDSVLHEIYKAFDLKGGATKEEILERLVAKFPDRAAEDMKSTVNTQINRMPKERGFELGRDDKGRYGLHIEGRSKVRVLSPEAQAKLDEARQAREAQKAADDKLKAEAKAAKAKADQEQAEAEAKKAGVTVNVPGAKVVGKAKK